MAPRVASHTLKLKRHHYTRPAVLREIYWGSLLKPGPLPEDEWPVMRLHPEHGSGLLEKLPFFSLAGDAIPLSARLFAVIDTLNAMTFDRPYRKALPFDTAKAEIVKMSDSQFDPLAGETFLQEEQLSLDLHQQGH